MKNLFSYLKQQNYLRGLSHENFVAFAARFLATLNAIHPFREENGRTQTSFLVLLADQPGHPLDLDKLVPERFLAAMVASFQADESLLIEELTRISGN
jgi:cell filamentation protein